MRQQEQTLLKHTAMLSVGLHDPGTWIQVMQYLPTFLLPFFL